MLGIGNSGLRISFREDDGGGGLRLPRRPLFELGRTVITAAAHAALNLEDVAKSMHRHHTGDWGDLCDEDRQCNVDALRKGARIFSVYHDRNKTKFYIVTEWDRSLTTVLLPEDY
jgi:hypothetical protein